MNKKLLDSLDNLDEINRAFECLAVLSVSSDYGEAPHVGAVLTILSQSLNRELLVLDRAVRHSKNNIVDITLHKE